MVRRCQRRRKNKSGKIGRHGTETQRHGEKQKSILFLPFFLCASVAGYAALVAACAAAGSSQRTDTSFETPGSCIVTPYRTEAISIVFRLCVTTMNWVPALISETSFVKRPTLASSSGAYTSSRMQKALG